MHPPTPHQENVYKLQWFIDIHIRSSDGVAKTTHGDIQTGLQFFLL